MHQIFLAMQIQKQQFIFLLFSLGLCFHIQAQENCTLQKALQTARSNNPFLKTEQLNVKIAESDIVTAKLRPNPSLNNQTLQLMQSSGFHENTQWHDKQNRQVWWQLTKPFQIAGQRKNKIELAGKNVLFAEKNYSETERNLFFDVANKWLEVWTVKRRLEIISTAKSNIDSLLFTNQNRYKNLVITQTDLYRTELLSKQYDIQLKTAFQEVNNHQSELKLLLGTQENVSADMSDDFLFAMPNTIDDLFVKAFQNRSDLQSVKSLIDVSDSNIKLQKSLSFPQPELGVIWNPQNAVQYFGVYANIDLPIFNRNQGEIKKSVLVKNQVENQLSALEVKVRTEIKIAYENYERQKQNIANFESLLKQSKTILDNVKYSYLKGGTTIVDFLEAQRSWLETQQQYYDTMQSYKQSYIQLLYTTGLINQLAL